MGVIVLISVVNYITKGKVSVRIIIKLQVDQRYLYILLIYRITTHSGNLGNFQVIENLRETQRIMTFIKLRETQGSFNFF